MSDEQPATREDEMVKKKTIDESDSPRVIGALIKARREKQKLTAAQLAEAVGVSENYIFQIEAGGRLPSMRVFLRIMEALKINRLSLPFVA
jgi:DNA-binding XRE family transcriptional regulator